MVTVEPFVETFLRSNNYLGNIKLVFIGENCPNLRTYFYRSLPANPNGAAGANPFLNNLCNAISIPIIANEYDRLKCFLEQRCLLIDAYPNNMAPRHRHSMADIYNDIQLINPEKIIFITKRNKQTIIELSTYAETTFGLHIPKIVPDFNRGELWHCFPGRPNQIIDFNAGIAKAICLKLI